MSSGSAAYRKEAEETQIMGSVLVIGGGAAGLAAAIAAAECGDTVTVAGGHVGLDFKDKT